MQPIQISSELFLRSEPHFRVLVSRHARADQLLSNLCRGCVGTSLDADAGAAKTKPSRFSKCQTPKP